MTWFEGATERAGEFFDRCDWALRDALEALGRQWTAARERRSSGVAPHGIVPSWLPAARRRLAGALRGLAQGLLAAVLVLDEALAVLFFCCLGVLEAPLFGVLADLVVSRGEAFSWPTVAPRIEVLRDLISGLMNHASDAVWRAAPLFIGATGDGLFGCCVVALPVASVVLRHVRYGFPALLAVGAVSAVVLERFPAFALGGPFVDVPSASPLALLVGGLLAATAARVQARRPRRRRPSGVE